MKVSIQKKGVEISSKSKVQQQQRSNSGKEPPAFITETIRNVKYEYCLLKTVHSMEELDDFRFKHNCDFTNAKRNCNFTRATLHCCKRKRNAGMCQFTLMVRRPHLESSDMHVYAHSEHNHPLKSEVERAAHRVPRKELVPDADPPISLTTPNGRQWTFLGTAKKQRKMEKYGLKNNCQCSKIYYGLNRISMQCNSSRKCKFRMLALKTERHRYHMYASDRHTCSHANDRCNTAGKKSAKAKNDVEEEPEEIQEEEMEQEQMGQEEAVENAGPSASNGDIEIDEQKEEWPVGKIQRRLAKALREESADRVNKWMARTGPGSIGEVLAGMDIGEVIKLLEIARKEMRAARDKENVTIWLDWIESAISFRGSELAKIPDLVDGLFSHIFKRIERRELLPKRRLRTFRKLLAAMRDHMENPIVSGSDS